MNKFIVFILALSFSLYSYSQEGYSPEEWAAQTDFQAGNYGKALLFYQNLLNVNLSPDQLSLVYYNLGTIYLAENDYPNALKNLQEALQGAGGGNPLLIRNAELNLALTRVRQVSTLMGKKGFDPALVIDWLRSAEYDLQSAQNAACIEDSREGYPECRLNPTFQAITKQIAELRAKLPADIKTQPMLPSLAFLQAALYAWHSKQPALADVFLQLALENVKKKEEIKFLTDQQTPEDMLKQLIYQQRELQQIGMQIKAEPALNESFIDTLKEIQTEFNHTARDFYPLIFKIQDSRFHSDAPPKENEDERCQKIPWNSVLPEFQKGLNDADKAAEALEEKRLQAAITKAETAATAWEQALAFLINPPKESAQAEQVQGQPKPHGQQPQEEKNQQPPQQGEKLENLLMNLQEMHLDSNQSGQTQGINLKEVDKPW